MKKSLYSLIVMCMLLAAVAYVVTFIHIPYFSIVYKKVHNLYEQYTVAKNAKNMVTEMNKVNSGIKMIDSLLNRQILREAEVKTGLVETLYKFADSSNLKASKVEIGEKISIEGRSETSISINGTGNFASMGKFLERIENYPRSTRIRQIVLKGTEKKSVEGFVDFVLME